MLQLIVAVGAFTLGFLVCAVLAIGTGVNGAGRSAIHGGREPSEIGRWFAANEPTTALLDRVSRRAAPAGRRLLTHERTGGTGRRSEPR